MKEKHFKIGFALWTIFCLAMMAVMIFVAAHFIQKYW